ncbi:MAG: DUF4131 domain-containing protein [Flavobacteriales bacterium]|nr:DUF4131 domain-containing protein [Flavobacteriales bacterium]
MKVWNSFPMLRVVLPIIFGVIVAAFALESVRPTTDQICIIYGCAILLSLGTILLSFIGRRPYLFGIALWPVLFLLGSLLTVSVSDYVFPNYLNPEKAGEQVFIAEVGEQPRVRTNSVEVIADVTDAERKSFGKVLFYFDLDSAARRVKYGQELVLKSAVDRVRPQGNPDEFNYARYLRFHNILFRGFVRSGDWEVLSNGNPGIVGWFADARTFLIGKLKESGLEGDELAVASALILGFRDNLDKELMSAYAGAGATHVLAVSGLHVGIVYLIINFFLRFMDRSNYLRWLKTLLLVVLLVGYAALTGFSASVSRAALMFTFVALGKAINRDTNIFNTLAASAFGLILYDPMIVMQVGFQLSYAAVFGIVVIQPKLVQLKSFENRWLDWAWSISCVSIAAQIATFPLGLLYFHQFPLLFLLSNLIVIPAAALILYIGFGLFVLCWWKPTLLFFGFILRSVISILNFLVVQIEQIPNSVLMGIDITTFETLLIYLIIISVLVFYLQKQKLGLYVSLFVSIVLVLMQVWEVNQQQHQRFSTIYNVRKETVAAFVNGTELTFVSSSKFRSDASAMLFNVKHHWWKKGVDEENWVELSDSVCNRVLEFGDERFAILNLKPSNDQAMSWKPSDSLDFAIIHSIGWDLIDQLVSLPTSKLIISNTLGTKTKERLTGVPNKEVVFVSEAGAYPFSY